jgi:hypothetical protein
MFLTCSGNRLTGLDLSGYPGLGYLDCHGNEIRRLDLRPTATLERVYAQGTVTAEDGYKRYELPRGDGAMNMLCVDDAVRIITGDTPEGVTINGESFPDETFRNYVSRFDTDEDGVLNEDEIAAVTEIDVQ